MTITNLDEMLDVYTKFVHKTVSRNNLDSLIFFFDFVNRGNTFLTAWRLASTVSRIYFEKISL